MVKEPEPPSNVLPQARNRNEILITRGFSNLRRGGAGAGVVFIYILIGDHI